MLLRKAVLIIILGLTCDSVIAKWTKIDNINNIYADLSTIQKSGNLVKLLSMNDFKTPQKVAGHKKYFSTKDRFEYDCKEVKSRQLSSIAYAGNVGLGPVIYKSTIIGEWIDVDPDSLVKTQWNVVCSKRKSTKVSHKARTIRHKKD